MLSFWLSNSNDRTTLFFICTVEPWARCRIFHNLGDFQCIISFTFFKPTFYLLQNSRKLEWYQSFKWPGPLLEQEANPAVNASSKKDLRDHQLLSQTPQGVANNHHTQLIDASAGVTYHEVHIKDLFMSLTREVLLIWVSLNEGLIASPLNIWFCSINLISSAPLVYSTKLPCSPTPASNSITIRAKPAVLAMGHHYSRWFQLHPSCLLTPGIYSPANRV